MAAFEDSTGPELDLFAGHSWTDWQNAVESDTAGNESSPESVSTRHGKEVAKLKRQDLGLFGYCPAKDNFYVVVCSHCGFPVKPQAFNYHIEKHHKDKGKVKGFNEPYKTTTKPRFEPSNDANITTETFPVHRVSPARHKQSEVFRDAEPKPSSVSKVKHELAPVKISPKHGTNFGNTGTPLPQQTDEKHKNQERGHRHQQMKIQRVKPDLVRKLSDVDKRGHTNKHHIKVAKRNHIEQSAKVFVGTSENRLNEVTSVVIKHREGKEVDIAPRTIHPAADKVQIASQAQRQYKHNHNPQLDIVKTSDRGNPQTRNHNGVATAKPTKVKKILPLKAREYDPDRHCGVWIAEEKTNCTRSLTCKSHSRSFKRKVTGRRKTYDELVTDHARAKMRLKEKSSQPLLSPPIKLKADAIHTSLPLPTATNSEPKIAPPTRNAFVQLGGAKAHGQLMQSPPKSKSSFMLFPRATSSPRYIDCWADSTFETDSKLPPKIPALAQHPTPAAVCRFGSRSLDKHHVSFNRRSDLQWRTCNTTFTQANFARQLLKQTRTNVPQHKTSLSFTPMKSASMSVLNFKEPSSNPCDCDITRELDTCETQVAQRSISAPNNRTNLGKSPDFHQKRTISSAPCDDKYSIIASQSVNSIHNTEISTSVNHPATVMVTHFKRPTVSHSSQNDSIPKKKKATLKARKTLARSLTQPGKATNNHIINNINTQLTKEIIKRPKSTEIPSTLIQDGMDLNYDVTATSNHLVPKEQIVPMNGISTNVINSHAWPQTVTLTGAIGALRRNNPDDIMKLHHNQSEVGLTEITRNHNNSNNYDITSDLSPLVDGRSERSAHIDTLQSLLGNSNPPSGLLVETTAPTGNGGSHEQHSFRQIGELLSLLDSGSKETTASQDLNSFSFRDSAIFETSNLTSNS